MPSIPFGLTRSAHDLRNPGFADTQGHVSKFIQVLDESMCVVREDICDWLQRYLFSSANAPSIEGRYLLYRLASGLWLSRLAYKLHCSVLQKPKNLAPLPTNLTRSNSHEFLRGGVSNPSLRTLSRDTLPPFPDSLVTCAKLPLGYADTCPYSDGEKSDESSAPSSSSSPDHVPVKSTKPGSKSNGIRVADLWSARDNVSTFIHWCKDLGIPSTVLFETTGLVNRTEEKNVLLTLMELARIASRFGLDDLPELVRMEREIDLLEAKRTQTSIIVTGRSPSPSVTIDVPLDSGSGDGSNTHVSAVTVQLRKRSTDLEPEASTTSVKVGASGDIVDTQTTVRIGGKTRQVNILRVCEPHSQTIDLPIKSKSGTSIGTDPVNVGSDASCGLDGSPSSNVMLDSSFSYSSSSGVSISTTSTSTDEKSKRTAETSPDSGCLSRASSTDRVASERAPADPFVADQVEKKVAQCTCCNRLHLQHLEEGRYRLGTRVYYFRRFRNHVMVRVGGGWLTLDAFLERHDPCRRGKSSHNSLSVVPNTNAPNAVMTADLSKRKLSEQVPEIKPPLMMGGSMVDLRRRWSKQSTSSNESAASCNSVPVNTIASSVSDCRTGRVNRNRSPNPLGSRKSGVVAPRNSERQNNRSRPATPVSNPAKALAQSRGASAGRRRVTPSPNTRGSNLAAKDSKPVRWR